MKKFKKGNRTWATRKKMLGWIIDTKAGTIALLPHRVERLDAILNSIKPNQRTIATKTWHKVMEELWSISIALPGSKGLFSLLKEAF